MTPSGVVPRPSGVLMSLVRARPLAVLAEIAGHNYKVDYVDQTVIVQVGVRIVTRLSCDLAECASDSGQIDNIHSAVAVDIAMEPDDEARCSGEEVVRHIGFAQDFGRVSLQNIDAPSQ